MCQSQGGREVLVRGSQHSWACASPAHPPQCTSAACQHALQPRMPPTSTVIYLPFLPALVGWELLSSLHHPETRPQVPAGVSGGRPSPRSLLTTPSHPSSAPWSPVPVSGWNAHRRLLSKVPWTNPSSKTGICLKLYQVPPRSVPR